MVKGGRIIVYLLLTVRDARTTCHMVIVLTGCAHSFALVYTYERSMLVARLKKVMLEGLTLAYSK